MYFVLDEYEIISFNWFIDEHPTKTVETERFVKIKSRDDFNRFLFVLIFRIFFNFSNLFIFFSKFCPVKYLDLSSFKLNFVFKAIFPPRIPLLRGDLMTSP